jgi:FkbM family methyltransferase
LKPRAEFSFLEIAPHTGILRIVDIGAAPSPEPPRYQSLVDRGRATVTGFEPDPEGFARLQAKAGLQERHFPFFIGDGGPGTYHKTNNLYTGSLYPPNLKLLRRFSALPDVVRPVSAESVQTHRLDDVLRESEIDFLKIDVQGAELAVLQGAERLLPTVLVAELEVEFVPLYVNQPLFADVDGHMRARDFQLHAFTPIQKYSYTPAYDRDDPFSGVNQVIYTDAIYIPEFATVGRLPSERVLKLVTLLHDVYGSWDLCLHLLKHLASRGLEGLFSAYANRLNLG